MSTLEKRLGKIESVNFGRCGYQEAQLGISFLFSGKDGWGVGFCKGEWDSEIIKCDKHCKWSEEDRTRNYAEIMRYVATLLKQAKVDNVYKLKGIPVECTFDGNLLKDWRILEEVL